MSRKTALYLTTALLLPAFSAQAHPHIFAEARLEVVASDDGKIAELRNVWRFDEVFSSSVLLDFDKNSNLKLDPEELTAVGNTVKESLADFGYYMNILQDGQEVDVLPPDIIHVDFKDGQLLMFFVVKPEKDLPLKGTLSFGVYDPTMYTSMDFANDEDMVLIGDAFKTCTSKVVRPDPDEVLAQNQNTLTEAFFNDPTTSSNLSKLFATRIEIKCP